MDPRYPSLVEVDRDDKGYAIEGSPNSLCFRPEEEVTKSSLSPRGAEDLETETRYTTEA